MILARRVARAPGIGLVIYLTLAYRVLPALWRHYEHLPATSTMPTVTSTSDGFLFGRHHDLAFEQEVSRSAGERHHVRFWRTPLRTDGDRPVWIGSAAFDRSAGLSHTTGQVTHHIAADVDAERDTVMRDLGNAGWLTPRNDVTGVGPTLDGRNGGGDRYYTDGDLAVGVLAPCGVGGQPAHELASPAPVVIKSQFWQWLRPALG